MQYLLSKEEYDDLIHAKELAEEKVREDERRRFVQFLEETCLRHGAVVFVNNITGQQYELVVEKV